MRYVDPRHRPGAFILLVAGCCLLSAASARADEPGRGPIAGKYALLVGVKEYDKNELRNLRYAEPDVVELGKVLKDNDYDRVVLMTQAEGANKARMLPMAANIRKELKGILEDRTEGDSVVIAFAGHGVQFRNSDETYFCPMDAKLADPTTLISLTEVYKQLEACPAGVRLLLVDACRNDPQSDNSRSLSKVKLESVTRPQKALPPGGVAALFSCSAGEKAFESEDMGHGVFFHFVIDGLRGDADLDGDRKVDLDELVHYVCKRVPDYVRDTFGADVRQMPELVGKTHGAFPLTSVAPGTATGRPRPNGELILKDDFDDREPRAVPLFDNRVMTLRNVDHQGRLVGTSPGVLPAMYDQPHAKDFLADFDLQASAPAGNSYGLVFRSVDVVNGGIPRYYMATVRPDNETVSLMCWDTSKWALAKSHDVKPGLLSADRPNHVRVEAVGNQFRVFVNQALAAEVEDDTLDGSGIFGLVVSSAKAKEDTVYFSKLRVYKPKSGSK